MIRSLAKIHAMSVVSQGNLKRGYLGLSTDRVNWHIIKIRSKGYIAGALASQRQLWEMVVLDSCL